MIEKVTTAAVSATAQVVKLIFLAGVVIGAWALLTTDPVLFKATFASVARAAASVITAAANWITAQTGGPTG